MSDFEVRPVYALGDKYLAKDGKERREKLKMGTAFVREESVSILLPLGLPARAKELVVFLQDFEQRQGQTDNEPVGETPDGDVPF